MRTFLLKRLFQAPGKPGPVRENQNLLALESSFLAVTCERLKQALYADLDVTAKARGLIYVTIRPQRGSDQNFAYSTERLGNTWIYRLDLPPQVEALLTFATFVVPIIGGLLIRRKVSPVHAANTPTEAE